MWIYVFKYDNFRLYSMTGLTLQLERAFKESSVVNLLGTIAEVNNLVYQDI